MDDPIKQAESLFEEGEALADQDRESDALAKFQQAWLALPEPKNDHDLAVPILAAIADGWFHLGDWDRCDAAAQEALRIGADPANPFLRLRIGQALYELGDETEAANWLTMAYLSAGDDLFEGEDPKYLEFVHLKLLPPPEGWAAYWERAKR